GARRASNLVSQLLRLARYDAAPPSGPVEEVDVSALANVCTREIEPLAADAGIRLNARTDAGLRIPGEAADLHVLISNLLDNAVRYTPRDGIVEIACVIDADGRGLVEIRDSGPG